jgi:signal transduction histidine kinase
VTTAARARARRDLVARAALEERMRLTGEVHDVAGHGFAVVAMHAGVALLVLDERPDQARASLEAIKATSEQALGELRGMLDAVQSDGGLVRVAELVDEMRASGLAVSLEMESLALPDDADQVAYRVVREALTNVLRHAGPTTAAVRIARDGGDALVRVRDGGRGTPVLRPGRGLSGMRRRVEAIGGRFEAGPVAGGGFEVAAHLPLREVAS